MDETLNPVSPHLTRVRYLARLPWCLILIIAALVWAHYFDGGTWGWCAAGAATVLLFWQIWLIPRQVHYLGWLETEDDLLLTRGRLWQTFTIIPYGRVQYLDVSQGPIERMYGLKTLRLNTASTTSNASIKGLDATLADELRARIAHRAKEKMIDL